MLNDLPKLSSIFDAWDYLPAIVQWIFSIAVFALMFIGLVFLVAGIVACAFRK